MPYATEAERAAARAVSQLKWRAKNPTYHAEWRRQNREAVRANKRKTQAARKARRLGQFVEHVEAKTVWLIYGGRCGICNEFIQADEAFHVDHIIPLSKGGLHGYVNCQPAHPLCNMRKGDRV